MRPVDTTGSVLKPLEKLRALGGHDHDENGAFDCLLVWFVDDAECLAVIRFRR